MKLSQSPSKIAGVQIGEATLNFIKPGEPPLRAKFALLNKDGEVCGFMETAGGWSEKAFEALQKFGEVLEAEAMARVFEVDDSTPAGDPVEKINEPPQF